jgi:hypothetical protein
MLRSPWRSRSATGRTQQERRAPPIEQLRVIVLDSSPTSRKILEVILRREGHQVACFDEPLEALRFLAGAQQVVTKPLAQQRIVALLAEYACRRTAGREASQQTWHPAHDHHEIASCQGGGAPDGAASSPNV